MFASVSPTCSPCGHVMQPVGPRTVWERAIGGQPVALWHGLEFECPACLTRTVLIEGASPSVRLMPGSVGYERIVRDQERPLIPAIRVIWGEHTVMKVRRDSTRRGGPLHLSQRQQALQIVEGFFAQDDSSALEALIQLAELFELDLPALTTQKARAIVATVDPSLHAWDGPRPEAIRDGSGLLIADPDAHLGATAEA